MATARQRILVINPNSDAGVTARIAATVAPLGSSAGIEIDCRTLEGAPPAIETEAHICAVAGPIAALVVAEQPAATVIACFSDPGLASAREAAAGRPVLGIAECALATALSLADRVGVIALSDRSIARHRRHHRQLGVESRIAGERPAHLGVAESGSEAALTALDAAGRLLVDEDGAGAIVLGCAGMAPQRAHLERHLDVPVIEPCRAAVAMAIGLVAV